MSSQLRAHGDDGGYVHCTICGGDAAGPCGRCRNPVCGNCCVLTEGTSGKWAICLRCDQRGGRKITSGWWGVAVWLIAPLAALVVLLAFLGWLFG
jgi:hypothetical protein